MAILIGRCHSAFVTAELNSDSLPGLMIDVFIDGQTIEEVEEQLAVGLAGEITLN